MKITVNKEFASRKELENYVRVTFGENEEKNKEISLDVSAEEAEKMLVDDSTLIHGVKIKTDGK